jgi:hypothetical protein
MIRKYVKMRDGVMSEMLKKHKVGGRADKSMSEIESAMTA